MTKVALTLAIVLVATAMLILFLRSYGLTKSAMASPRGFKKNTLEVIAHRGGALEVPENTVYAFKHAISLDPNIMVEFDVHSTKDGEFVVIHDSTLGRTTVGEGSVVSKTLD